MQGSRLYSSNAQYFLLMQSDGNLVLCATHPPPAFLWHGQPCCWPKRKGSPCKSPPRHISWC
jgi:hypothetical protein